MTVDQTCAELQRLQRARRYYIKQIISVMNRLVHSVAFDNGYTTTLTKEERKKAFTEAEKDIKKIIKEGMEHKTAWYVIGTSQSAELLKEQQSMIEKDIVTAVQQLPIHTWVLEPEQKGFKFLSLGVVVGEAGNLSNYPNPGKLWKRMGCAPFNSQDKTLMGSTWKSEWKRKEEGVKKLSDEEWTEYGYNPRRRSSSWVIGDCLMKLNKEGPYRKRYEESRVVFLGKHPDASKGRCNSHGMLCACKLLLKNLWIEWHHVIGPKKAA